MLLADGYQRFNPSHPLGGKDGGRDATAERDGKTWVMAVHFSRGPESFTAIKKKVIADAKGAAKHGVGLAFVTNQELKLAERDELEAAIAPFPLDLYHLERVAALLDTPGMKDVRTRFLGGDDGPRVTINSINQSGGQVAERIVNHVQIGRPQRNLYQDQGNEIVAHLRSRPRRTFYVSVKAGDETGYLAQLLAAVLQDGGWNLDGIGTMHGGSYATGVLVHTITEDPDASEIAAMLSRFGIATRVVTGDEARKYRKTFAIKDDWVGIWVGSAQ